MQGIGRLALLILAAYVSYVATDSGDKNSLDSTDLIAEPIAVSNGTLDECKEWEWTYTRENAPYVGVHFTKFNIAEGDVVVIGSDKETVKVTIPSGETKFGFSSERIEGPTVTVTFIPNGCVGSTLNDFGLNIDALEYSYLNTNVNDEICGSRNQNVDAVCFKDDAELGDLYQASMTVARLRINVSNGTGVVEGSCTGFLVGSKGQMLTNNHCIPDDETAKGTTVEFMAQNNECNASCVGCEDDNAIIESVGTELLYTNKKLDFSLIQLKRKSCILEGKYGHLSLRREPPRVNESIYLVGHLKGKDKQITHLQDLDNLDKDPTTGPHGVTQAVIVKTNFVNMYGEFWAAYYADTETGSSGSPVLSMKDNSVLVLHANGECRNSGTPSNLIIDTLKKEGIKLPDDAFA